MGLWSGCIGIGFESWASAFCMKEGVDGYVALGILEERGWAVWEDTVSVRGCETAICSCGILYGVYSDCYKLPYSPFIVSTISLKLSSPASTFSIISFARISGSGKLSRSARLSSFTQKISRFVLSRDAISS